MKSSRNAAGGEAILQFEQEKDWATWLHKNHGKSSGVWLRLAKKASGIASISYVEAIEAALCYGWIDGQKKSDDEHYWLQKFTRRTERSIWSKINREKALKLVDAGKMKLAGLKEIERAKADGRWNAAYDSPSKATVPSDLQAALDANARAKSFFATLDGANRYAILFRIQNVKKAETRTKRIKKFIEMLEKHEKVHP
jgi:uncharacterized protein YdeI (YjbR/CyaY-like superfamily)